MKNLPSKNIILVTGAHRTGTTWVGKILSKAPGMCYIAEPFNPQYFYRDEVPIQHWYEFVSTEDDLTRQSKMESYLRSSMEFHISDLYPEIKKHSFSLEFLARVKMHFSKLFSSGRILKDPIALFSAEWIQQTFHTQVVVLIRHPAAFAASLKSANWRFNFQQLLQQKHLMEFQLAPFRSRMEEFDRNVRSKDIIDYAILLWNIFYSRIYTYQQTHSDWLFIRHEDLSLDPVHQFKTLFKKLDLSFSARVQKSIQYSSTAVEDKKLERNSRNNAFKWKTTLTEIEIERIKQETAKYWPLFYQAEEW